MSSRTNFDVGIIGGGVIGLSCAWRLAQAGARVAVFERGQVGREASWAAAGMLAAQCEAAHHPPAVEGSFEYSKQRAMLDLCLQSRAMYSQFADELFDATGIDIELSIKGHSRNDWRTPGILYVQTRDDDPAFSAFKQQRESGLSVENAPDFNYFQSTWLPDEGQVNNRILVIALEKAVRNMGVEIFENQKVSFERYFDERRTSIHHIRCGDEIYNCDKVIVCAGSWSSEINCRVDIPVGFVSGEMIELQADDETCLRNIAYASDVYLIPRRNYKLLVGATMKPVSVVRKHITVWSALTLLRAAQRVSSAVGNYQITNSWVGHRPSTPDGLPILGSTLIENFYVSTGHYRNGILLAPVTAKIMTDCIVNGVEPPREFSIERFQNIENKQNTENENTQDENTEVEISNNEAVVAH